MVISSFEGTTVPLTVELSGHPGDGPVTSRLSWIDDDHDAECVRATTVAERAVRLTDAPPAGTVLMISTGPVEG